MKKKKITKQARRNPQVDETDIDITEEGTGNDDAGEPTVRRKRKRTITRRMNPSRPSGIIQRLMNPRSKTDWMMIGGIGLAAYAGYQWMVNNKSPLDAILELPGKLLGMFGIGNYNAVTGNPVTGSSTGVPGINYPNWNTGMPITTQPATPYNPTAPGTIITLPAIVTPPPTQQPQVTPQQPVVQQPTTQTPPVQQTSFGPMYVSPNQVQGRPTQYISQAAGTYGNTIIGYEVKAGEPPPVAVDATSGLLAWWSCSQGPAPSFYANQPERVSRGCKIEGTDKVGMGDLLEADTSSAKSNSVFGNPFQKPVWKN